MTGISQASDEGRERGRCRWRSGTRKDQGRMKRGMRWWWERKGENGRSSGVVVGAQDRTVQKSEVSNPDRTGTN